MDLELFKKLLRAIPRAYNCSRSLGQIPSIKFWCKTNTNFRVLGFMPNPKTQTVQQENQKIVD
jgi:hypothetical protein